MKLTFIGTRANIKRHAPEHQFNASCLVSHRSTTIMIDCGTNWLNRLAAVRPIPDGILITHAHPDHIQGLAHGAPCPVYALKESLDIIRHYPLRMRKVIKLRKPFVIGNITIQAFSVEHAINAPAVGYRITAGNKTIFYVPDLVYIRQCSAALRGIDLYIGDGARVRFPLVRHKDGRQLGHTTIVEQLRWCRTCKVPQALFTHCGTEIVKNHTLAVKKIRDLGQQVGIKAHVAYDGKVVRI